MVPNTVHLPSALSGRRHSRRGEDRLSKGHQCARAERPWRLLLIARTSGLLRDDLAVSNSTVESNDPPPGMTSAFFKQGTVVGSCSSAFAENFMTGSSLPAIKSAGCLIFIPFPGR